MSFKVFSPVDNHEVMWAKPTIRADGKVNVNNYLDAREF